MIVLLIVIAMLILIYDPIKTIGVSIMAQVQELSDALNAAAASVQALADAFKAKPAGIDPAALDPILSAASALKAVADNALNPPAPVASPEPGA